MTNPPLYTDVDLKIDKSNNAHVVFSDGTSLASATKLRSSGLWSIRSIALDAGLPRLALTSQGLVRFTAFAFGFNGRNGQVYGAEQPNGSFTLEFAGDGNCVHGDIALDSHGLAHISCGIPGLFYYSRDASGTWTKETLDSFNDGDTSLAIDSHDRPHNAFRYGLDSGSTTLGYATRTSTGWSLEQPALQTLSVYGTDIELDSNDRPFVVFSQACLDFCANPLGLGGSDEPWIIEPVVGASPDAFVALAQNVLQAAGLP
jgi:hypothetical protein